MSIKAVHAKLNPDGRTREYCQFLQQESARVWNRAKNFFWRTYRKKGIWLKSNSLQKYNRSDQLYDDEQFHLNSQSIQSVAQQFTDNLKSAREAKKENPDIRYPYKNKRYFRVLWKGTGNAPSVKVKGRNIILSNGQGNHPLKLRLPRTLANCQPKTVELIWRNGCYWLSLVIKVDNDKQLVKGDGVAACDMFASLSGYFVNRGEIHAMSITDGIESLIISGRKLREAKQYRNRRIAQLQEKMSKCTKYSRRWNKLNRTKQRVQERAHRRIKDLKFSSQFRFSDENKLNRKITFKAIGWCVKRGIKTLVVGDLSGISKNTKGRLSRGGRQKISQWSYYTQKQYLKYKGEEVGIEVVEVDEAYTTKTCPRCGNYNRPKNRNYVCAYCGMRCHRDVVGAYNILTVYRCGFIIADDLFPHPKPKYLRILFTAKRKSSSSPDGGLMPRKGFRLNRAGSCQGT